MNATRNVNTGACTYLIIGTEFDLISSSDNCAIDLTNYTLTGATNGSGESSLSGVNLNNGVTTVIWTVTDEAGNEAECSFTVSVTKTGDPTLLSAYTILSKADVDLKENIVESGGVGVILTDKKIFLEQNSKIIATNTFAKAQKIDIRSGSAVTTKILSSVPSGLLPTFIKNNNPGSNNKIIPDNSAPVILDLESYGTVELGKNVTATFSGHDNVLIKELRLKEGSTLLVEQSTNLIIDRNLTGNKNSTINSASEHFVQFYVEEDVKFEEGSEVNANIYTLKKIQLTRAKSTNRTYMTGLFIATTVVSDEFVTWNWDADNCYEECPDDPNKTEAGICGCGIPEGDCALRGGEKEDVINGEVAINKNVSRTSLSNEEMLLYPNPVRDLLYVKFPVQTDSPIRIQILNHLGQELFNQQFSSNIDKGTIIKINIGEYSGGLYFIKALVDDKKLIKTFSILK
jgi:hypothetical protein